MVAIAYRRWSFTRVSISKAWTGKILVFWIKCLLMAVTGPGSLMRCGRTWKFDLLRFAIKCIHMYPYGNLVEIKVQSWKNWSSWKERKCILILTILAFSSVNGRHAAPLGLLTHVVLSNVEGDDGNKNGKKAIDLARAFLCISLSSLHDDYDVKFPNCTVCVGRLWKARFPYLPKTFGNFYEKVDRMNNVLHLTQVRFVYAFVTTPN